MLTAGWRSSSSVRADATESSKGLLTVVSQLTHGRFCCICGHSRHSVSFTTVHKFYLCSSIWMCFVECCCTPSQSVPISFQFHFLMLQAPLSANLLFFVVILKLFCSRFSTDMSYSEQIFTCFLAVELLDSDPKFSLHMLCPFYVILIVPEAGSSAFSQMHVSDVSGRKMIYLSWSHCHSLTSPCGEYNSTTD